jgi:hypothetical protein
MSLTKLERTLVGNPELSPTQATVIEVQKVADPLLRAALLAVVDLAIYAKDGEAPEVVKSRGDYEAKLAAEAAAKAAKAKPASVAPPAPPASPALSAPTAATTASPAPTK